MPFIQRPIVLASASPYRAKLLKDALIDFEIVPAHINESLHPVDRPDRYVRSLAARKALAVAPGVAAGTIVIAADTICAIGDEIIGKPDDSEDALRMLKMACASRTQKVITGVCVIDTSDMLTTSFSETSLVEMRDAGEEELAAYVATGEPMGKCGALCIESGRGFVKSFSGSYSNIMGLPMERLMTLLLKLTTPDGLSEEE